MTPEQFNSICELSTLPDSWLSKHVGRVSVRTWKYWRKGRPGASTKIPVDVIENMTTLNRYLKNARFMSVII